MRPANNNGRFKAFNLNHTPLNSQPHPPLMNHHLPKSVATRRALLPRPEIARPSSFLSINPMDIEFPVLSPKENGLASPIMRLPNEMLHHIASFLMPHTTVNVMEGLGTSFIDIHPYGKRYYSVKSSIQRAFTRELSDLRNCALVCRHFRLIVERILYQNICLPQSAPDSAFGLFQYPVSSVPYLARTLLGRPDLAVHTKSLKIWIRDRRLVSTGDEPDLFKTNPYHDVFKEACFRLSRVQMSAGKLNVWVKELHRYQELNLTAALISLLPRLNTLELMWPFSLQMLWRISEGRGRDRRPDEQPNYSCLDYALRNSSISSLYIASHAPIKTLPAATLTDLTADLLFFGDRLNWLTSTDVLPNVRRLAIVLNIPFLRRFYIHRVLPRSHPLEGLQIFLARMVPNLKSLAIEPPKGTEPHFHTQKDKSGIELPDERMDKDPQDLEFDPSLHVFPGRDFWDQLLFALKPVRSRLLHFSLPPNWYSSTGRIFQPMPNLQDFHLLKTLHLPNVTFIGNPQSQGYDPDVHETNAVTFLPKTLEKLTVTQTNAETCEWLQDGFQSKEMLPELAEVSLHFREDYWVILPEGFEVDVIRAGVRVFGHWRGGIKEIRTAIAD